MKYAVIDGTTVKNTGTIQELFPNTSFSGRTPNASFLADNNVVEVVETLAYTTPAQKLSVVDILIILLSGNPATFFHNLKASSSSE